MKSRVTKKTILDGAKICVEKGYWSEEVRVYLEEFTNEASKKLSNILYSIYIGNNPQASKHYDLILSNGLFNRTNSEIIHEINNDDEEFVNKEYKKVRSLLTKCTLETMLGGIIND